MVTKKPKGLGRGLEALLGPQVSDATPSRDGGGVHPSAVKLDQLRPGRYQPRTRMDEGSLFELAESIRSQGVMQPVLVRPLPACAAVSAWRWSRPAPTKVAGDPPKPLRNAAEYSVRGYAWSPAASARENAPPP